MAMLTKLQSLSLLLLLLLLLFTEPISGESPSGCGESEHETCRNSARALKYKIIAIASILVASILGVSLPLVLRQVPIFSPEKDLFTLVKAFASGVILATGYMHVLPDSFDDLRSDCLPDNPWKKFPFSTFVAMISALLTLMVESFAMSRFQKSNPESNNFVADENPSVRAKEGNEMVHFHAIEAGHQESTKLLKHRVVAQVLEMGIVVHSVVIGLSMGASDNPCTIRPLVIAICFHQFFEGMGLGGCIVQAEYGLRMKAILVFFFASTTPFGIALGIGISKVYSEDSPTALIVEGLLNAASAGLLQYMALVELLAADFLGPKLQGNAKLQLWAFVCVFGGAGLMSLMAKWA
ncbi:fe(2+) transport protein 1-like [Tripterygium wilfordii]|uniref:fe(2+) transport protein 1-like n=1 Tax=Tripterygium wilfordii TaxID=458696 RepID=UPI0018F82CB4|nr:fe(2+) transport protein 1-like [Tripterygium wilfordii]